MAEFRAGWVTLYDTPEITCTDGTKHTFKRGELLPSWLYASFPRAVRQKYFKKNDKLLGEVYGGEGAQGKF